MSIDSNPQVLDQASVALLIARLRLAVDQALVGQEDAKKALLVAVLAKEHLLLEGAPGSGKTQLAEMGLNACGAGDEVHLCSFHRDTRREDLLGEVALRRHKLGGRKLGGHSLGKGDERGERLSFDLIPGKLLGAPLVVLDNLGRAPGEALAPLLHLLGSRSVQLGQGGSGRPIARTVAIPLETAVATLGLPELEIAQQGVSIDPLEPSQLDRFALQVRLEGLVYSRSWRDCRAVLDDQVGSRAVDPSWDETSTGVSQGLATGERHALQAYVERLAYGPDVQRVAAETVERLAKSVRRAERQAGTGASARQAGLLSDRVFGAVLPKLLRAHAVLRGAHAVEATDLRVLRLMVAQRLPKESMDVLEELLEEAINPPTPAEDPASSQDTGDQGLPIPMDAGHELSEDAATPGQVPGGPTTEADLPEAPALPPRRRRPRPADVEPLIRAFEGRLDRGRSDLDDDPGGQPRGFRALRRFDEILDADPLDALLLVDGSLAGPPRVLRRRRRTLGGAVVIARDVSSSMAGFRNDWASELICGLINASAKRRMRVGYLEFHQRAMPKQVGGRLLHRGYRELNVIVRESRPMGQTNYEAPLRMALDALRGRRGANRHVVMLTDGLPILGDTQVRAERALAKRLGVSLHTVFIGDGESPAVLDAISRETDGLRFQAKEVGGGLVLTERESSVVAA